MEAYSTHRVRALRFQDLPDTVRGRRCKGDLANGNESLPFAASPGFGPVGQAGACRLLQALASDAPEVSPVRRLPALGNALLAAIANTKPSQASVAGALWVKAENREAAKRLAAEIGSVALGAPRVASILLIRLVFLV